MENNKVNQNAEPNAQQGAAPIPAAGAAGSGEKLFTQDDVNRIVQERLSRVKADTAPQFADKEKELQQRESRLNCREFLAETGKPAALLDILDTTDFEKFKASVELMAEKMPQAFNAAPQPKPTGIRVDVGVPTSAPHGVDPVAECFAPGGSSMIIPTMR